jgi:CRISPR-associated protein Cmr6
MLDGFNGTSWQVKQFTARTRWRLVAGLGIASTLEASMSMHPVYGFPYIPGSSLKGMARACAESLVKKGDEKAQTAINDIFGPDPEDDKKEEARRGKVIFFDAMPEKLPELDVDIINSHYSDYYEGKAPPADWLSPIPVYFLAVRPKTPFRFAVASKDETLAGQADAWLREGLDKLGVGSKTMVGYGHFDVPKDKQA